MSSNTTRTNCSGDELWYIAFSNVGRAYGKPLNKGEIAKAIQAITGSGSTIKNGGADTSHAIQYQLYLNPLSNQQQESSGKQYEFVLCDPLSIYRDSADKDVITVGMDVMAEGPLLYPSKSSGIPGRRGHLVPGSSRPWRVNEQVVHWASGALPAGGNRHGDKLVFGVDSGPAANLAN